MDTIVIESAFDDEEFVQKAGKYGVSAFMVKPIDSKTLVSTFKSGHCKEQGAEQPAKRSR